MKQTLVYILDLISSLRLAVIGLFSLFILVLYGTFYQLDHGIFLAKRDIFYTWFTKGDLIPIPGGLLIFTILGINLLFSVFRKIPYKLKNSSLFVMHWGLILLLLGALQIHYSAEEGMVGLWESGSTNKIFLSNYWNLNLTDLEGKIVKSSPFNKKLIRSIDSFFPEELRMNSRVIKWGDSVVPTISETSYLNSSGIKDFTRTSGAEQSMIPGLVLQMESEGIKQEVLLFGGDSKPSTFETISPYSLQLSEKTKTLPFSVKLIDFSAVFFQDSETPESFSSDVEIIKNGLIRKGHISMNEPLRIDNYTIYQTSYQIDQTGKEASVFTVVKNSFPVFPYIVSLIITAGLILHFILTLRRPLKEQN